MGKPLKMRKQNKWESPWKFSLLSQKLYNFHYFQYLLGSLGPIIIILHYIPLHMICNYLIWIKIKILNNDVKKFNVLWQGGKFVHFPLAVQLMNFLIVPSENEYPLSQDKSMIVPNSINIDGDPLLNVNSTLKLVAGSPQLIASD